MTTTKTINNRQPYRVSFIHAHSASPLRLCVRFLLCAMMLISFAACSDQNGKDDPDDPGFETGIPTEVRITLSTRSGNQTRSEGDDPGTPKDPNASVEFIHNWWIALVDTKGNVTILTRNEAKDKEYTVTGGSTNQGTSPNDGFEIETFKATIPTGTYDIYAFANIKLPLDSDNEPDKEVIEKIVNGEIATLDALLSAVNNVEKFDDKGRWSSGNIPMTGYLLNQKVNNTIEETFSIEVIRAVAKIEFSFDNPSNDMIKLHHLLFGPVTKSSVSLFPEYDVLGKKAYTPLDNAVYNSFDYYTSVQTIQLEKGDKGTFNCYCKESLANPDGQNDGSFEITLGILKNGDTEEKDVITKTFYTKNVKNYINRNDWIHIPISFTQWLIRWRMHYYPPIGGYRPLFEQSNDGEKVEILATTAGEFEIFPDIFDNGSEYTLDETEWNNVTIDQIIQTDLKKNELPDGKSLFVTTPTKQESKGTVANKDRYYIAGEFSNVEGIVTIVVKFKLSAGPYANQLKTCTFTITRKNGNP